MDQQATSEGGSKMMISTDLKIQGQHPGKIIFLSRSVIYAFFLHYGFGSQPERIANDA
jgi:hypothetical protein